MSFAQFWYLLLLRRGLYYDKQIERGKAIILHLTKEGLCESRCDVGGDGFYVATEKGRGVSSKAFRKFLFNALTAAGIIWAIISGLVPFLSELLQ